MLILQMRGFCNNTEILIILFASITLYANALDRQDLRTFRW